MNTGVTPRVSKVVIAGAEVPKSTTYSTETTDTLVTERARPTND